MFEKKSKIIGYLFATLHGLLIWSICMISLFSNNLYVLSFAGINVLGILISNYVYGDCPVSYFEEYHLGYTFVDKVNSMLPIKYDKKRRPEVTLQWIFMISLIIGTKIGVLLLLKTFNEKVCRKIY
jgi:ABC-type Na+ efflux pump permease subunit